jgi:hypothetical protein
MIRHGWLRTAIVLTVFAAVFISLTVSSYRHESTTVDEPQHIATGYSALVLKDYRIDPLHPPLLRMWAALPLPAMSDVHFNTNTEFWTDLNPWAFCHQFMFVDNDADRLLASARLMTVLLGLLLGVLLFYWSRELFGFGAATIVLGLYCLEPNILAHFRLATTDPGVTCFIFGTVYFLWRTTRQPTPWNLTGLIVFFALAQISKFSALILFPITVTLLAVHGYRTGRWRTALGIVAALAVASYAAIWAVHRFQYAPSPPGGGLEQIVTGPKVHQRLGTLANVLDWVDLHRLLPNTYVQGFSLSQAQAQTRPAYLFGRFNTTGWWYYFPVAFLIKTPVALIILFLAGLALCAGSRATFLQKDVFFLLPPAMYLCAAMTVNTNIGLRHILPIYPFALLIAGRTVEAILASRRKLLVGFLVALCLFQIGEVAVVSPHYLAFFNCLIGGPKNGYKYLADSNIDWGQDLKNLKKWMDANGVDHINLAYFGSADPEYYGIKCTYLLGSPPFASNRVEQAVLPGLVAVSVHNLTGAGLDGNSFYKPLLDAAPVAVIGYSIRVYRVEKPWWRASSTFIFDRPVSQRSELSPVESAEGSSAFPGHSANYGRHRGNPVGAATLPRNA